MSTADILAGIRELRALVVGDICLDRWCTYDPSLAEPSRETGIPRTAVTATERTPGAGGTVANNLAALGAKKVAVLGAIGDDGFGYELMAALHMRGIETDLLVKSSKFGTFTYTKLLNSRTGDEDLPRLDFVNTNPLPTDIEAELIDQLDRHIQAFDVILVSDQAETAAGGGVTPALRERLARHAGKLIWVDSRLRPEHFRNVIIKGNREEIDAACMRAQLATHAALRTLTAAPVLMVTEGPCGVTIVDEGGTARVTTNAIERPVDICGAGDSFNAAAALALRVTGSPIEAARFGNLVASLTIMKNGTGTASPEEVLRQ